MATAKRQILVIQPFDKPSTEGVYQLIRSASLLANATVSRVDSVLRADSDVLQSIQSAIQSASLLVADVTNTNPNVMFEVGFAQAQNKPLLLVANSSRSVPFDLTRVRIIIYDVANPNEFVDRLAKAISSALENPEAFLWREPPPGGRSGRVCLSAIATPTENTSIDCLSTSGPLNEMACLTCGWTRTFELAISGKKKSKRP